MDIGGQRWFESESGKLDLFIWFVQAIEVVPMNTQHLHMVLLYSIYRRFAPNTSTGYVDFVFSCFKLYSMNIKLYQLSLWVVNCQFDWDPVYVYFPAWNVDLGHETFLFDPFITRSVSVCPSKPFPFHKLLCFMLNGVDGCFH